MQKFLLTLFIAGMLALPTGAGAAKNCSCGSFSGGITGYSVRDDQGCCSGATIGCGAVTYYKQGEGAGQSRLRTIFAEDCVLPLPQARTGALPVYASAGEGSTIIGI